VSSKGHFTKRKDLFNEGLQGIIGKRTECDQTSGHVITSKELEKTTQGGGGEVCRGKKWWRERGSRAFKHERRSWAGT